MLGWRMRENAPLEYRDACCCAEAESGNEDIHESNSAAASIAMSPRRGGLDFGRYWVNAGDAIETRDGVVDGDTCNIVDGRAGACDVRRDDCRTGASLHCCWALLMEEGKSIRDGSPWF
jgi:hypothetical protein